MCRHHISVLALLVVASVSVHLYADDPEELIKRGTLIFSDDFNRTEEGDTLEVLGKGWETNTKDGNRADLQNDTLVITKGEKANHSLSVRHVNPFDDGIVKLRFQLFDKTGLKVNFNDKSANKITWAGHIARVVVQPHVVTIQDDKTGYYDLDIRKKRLSEDLDDEAKAELATFLATKQTRIKTSIELENVARVDHREHRARDRGLYRRKVARFVFIRRSGPSSQAEHGPRSVGQSGDR